MEIIRGQRVKLSDVTGGPGLDVDVTIQVAGLDRAQLQFLCLILRRDETPVDDQPLIDQNTRRSRCGSVAAGDREIGRQSFAVHLAKAPADVGQYMFLLAINSPGAPVPYHADMIREGSVTLASGGRTLATYRFHGSDFGKESAIHLISLYFKDVWRVSAVGGGFVGGLKTLLSRYRVPPALIEVASSAGRLLPAPGPGPGSVTPTGPSGEILRRLPEVWPGHRPPAIPSDLVRMVGFVLVERAGGQFSSGTGFVISPGGHFLTCQHVIEGAVRVSIGIDGTNELRPAEILRADEDSDVALCWISDREGVADWFLLAEPGVAPTLGLELGLFGYPLGADLGLSVTYSQGIVNSLRRQGELHVLQIDAGAAPGSSGGPVFRRSDGRVVGILTSGLNLQGQGMLVNFAIDLRAVRRLGWLG